MIIDQKQILKSKELFLNQEVVNECKYGGVINQIEMYQYDE